MFKTTKDFIDKEKIYSELSVKYNLDVNLVKQICERQFKETSDIMYREEDKCVKLPYIGQIYKKSNNYQ